MLFANMLFASLQCLNLVCKENMGNCIEQLTILIDFSLTIGLQRHINVHMYTVNVKLMNLVKDTYIVGYFQCLCQGIRHIVVFRCHEDSIQTDADGDKEVKQGL